MFDFDPIIEKIRNYKFPVKFLKVRDIPEDSVLRNLIETSIIASMRTEENRGVKFRIMYISMEEVNNQSGWSESDCSHLCFDKKRIFSVKELVRISPSLQFDQSVIIVHSEINSSEEKNCLFMEY